MIAKKIQKFLDIFNGKKYALVGSGSCTENIIEILINKNLPLPEGIYDNGNLGKNIGTFVVEDINLIDNVDVLLLATFEFKKELSKKVADKSFGRIVTAIGDYSCETYASNSITVRHPIIINTIPKCGNVFIFSTIQKDIAIKHQDISAGPWPELLISEKRINHLLDHKNFAVEHFKYNEYNLGVLEDANISKIIMHARDPRQATLSWLHWLDKRQKEGIISQWEIPSIVNYFDLSFTEKLDYQIDNWLPGICEYLLDWVNKNENDSLEVKYTDFCLMADDPQQFFNELYEFFGVEHYVDNILVPEKGKMHFRKGLKNEWLEVFNDEQIKKSSAMISSKLKETFGWY